MQRVHDSLDLANTIGWHAQVLVERHAVAAPVLSTRLAVAHKQRLLDHEIVQPQHSCLVVEHVLGVELQEGHKRLEQLGKVAAAASCQACTQILHQLLAQTHQHFHVAEEHRNVLGLDECGVLGEARAFSEWLNVHR